MRRHCTLGGGRVAFTNGGGDAFMARDAGQTLSVGPAAVPADAPSLAGDDPERSDYEREQRVPGRDGDCGVKRDVMLHRLFGMGKTLSHGGGVARDILRLNIQPPQRRKRDRPNLDRPPHVVNLLNRDLVGVHRMVEHEPEHVFVDRAHPGAPPISQINDA